MEDVRVIPNFFFNFDGLFKRVMKNHNCQLDLVERERDKFMKKRVFCKPKRKDATSCLVINNEDVKFSVRTT